MELLDGCFSVRALTEEKDNLKTAALEMATQMLTLPTPPAVHQHVKALLAVLHNNRTAYSNHKDQALLNYVLQCLNCEGKPSEEMDGEAFYRLISIARGVAVSRPSNLVRFAESQDQTLVDETSEGGKIYFKTFKIIYQNF
ncbi:E3 ubiquitin-protein ligase UBR4-like [Centruroides sculpturatus]|nr:E3 ubiquitin-protein ligase UBR4-like [Centruroides sculpturatus]